MIDLAKNRSLLEVDLIEGRYRSFGFDGGQAEFVDNFGVEALLKWLGRASPDPDDPRLRAEATNLFLYLDGLRDNKPPSFTGMAFGSANVGTSLKPMRGWWYVVFMVALWIALWLLGVYLIYRRAMRRAKTVPG